MPKSQFPKSEGWITADLTLTSADIWSADQVTKWVETMGYKPAEIGTYKQQGKRLRIVFRKPVAAPSES